MKKHFKLLLLVILLCGVLVGFASQETTQGKSEDDFQTMVEELKESTVTIRIIQMKFKVGIGSGMIYDKEETSKGTYYYYVVTNHHVVDGATHVELIMNDGSIEVGDVYVAGDSNASIDDIGVVRFESNKTYKVVNIPSQNVLKPTTLTIGQKVFGIGTPVDEMYSNNVSDLGIVTKQTANFIIHTSNINPGNSGGPLFTMDGTFVGINTQRLELIDGEIIDGIAESLVVDRVRYLIDLRLKSVTPKLGINILNHDAFLNTDYSVYGEQAANFNPHELIKLDTKGAVIIDVGSTRPSFGLLKQFDLVVEVNGNKVENVPELSSALGELRAGQTYIFKLYRLNETTNNFELLSVSVTL